jgi:hypothetical protein
MVDQHFKVVAFDTIFDFILPLSDQAGRAHNQSAAFGNWNTKKIHQQAIFL